MGWIFVFNLILNITVKVSSQSSIVYFLIQSKKVGRLWMLVDEMEGHGATLGAKHKMALWSVWISLSIYVCITKK